MIRLGYYYSFWPNPKFGLVLSIYIIKYIILLYIIRYFILYIEYLNYSLIGYFRSAKDSQFGKVLALLEFSLY